MQIASFTLEHFFYAETTVKANIEFKRTHDEPASEPQVSITIPEQVASDDSGESVLQMALGVTVSITSPADPYEIAILAVGRFKSSPSLSAQELLQQVVLSGPHMLYSATREYILGLTSRSAWGEFNLPAVVFGPEDFRKPDSD